MSDVTERLRYYDGEYLRAFDFDAEQAYHLEMRRRLNRTLHLIGIAAGLYLEEDEDSVPSDPLFHISPGMAIDALGREILLTAPRTLDQSALMKKGLKAQKYGLWLVYKEQASRPAAPGYQTCDAAASSTRWREGYDLVFLPIGQTHGDGVQLGTVQLTVGGGGLAVVSVANDERTYVGINASRIVHPMFAGDLDPSTITALQADVPALKPPGRVLKEVPPTGWLDVQPSLAARQDVAVAGNTVFGDDFDKSDPLPASPPAQGNVKIDGTLYLRRSPQILVGNAFKTIDQVVKTQVDALVLPEFVSDVVEVPADSAGTTVHSFGEATITVASTRVANPGKMHCAPSIIGVRFDDKSKLPNWWSPAADNDISVTATLTTMAASSFKLVLRWELNGNVGFATAGPIKFVRFHYLIVLVP